MFRSSLCISFLLLFFCSCGNGPTVIEHVPKSKTNKPAVPKATENFKKGLVYGLEMKKSNRTPYEDAYAKVGDTVFICDYKGKMDMKDTLSQKRSFLFNLHAEFMVDRIFIIPLSGDRWFVSWQETDHEGVKSYAACFKTGAPKPEWRLFFDVPNPGIPVLDGENVYVTYLGIAAKLAVDDGKYQWKHDSLFNTVREPYKKFESPRVFDNKVEFVDFPIPGHREKRDTLRVNPETGEVIK